MMPTEAKDEDAANHPLRRRRGGFFIAGAPGAAFRSICDIAKIRRAVSHFPAVSCTSCS